MWVVVPSLLGSGSGTALVSQSRPSSFSEQFAEAAIRKILNEA